MKKTITLLLAIIIVGSTVLPVSAASGFSVRIDKAVYSRGDPIFAEITCASNDWFAAEILKGDFVMMSYPLIKNPDTSLPPEYRDTIFQVFMVPANWEDGTDYVLRVGRGSDIASVRFEVASEAVSIPKVAGIAASPVSTQVEKGTRISLSTATQGAAIHYTTNGQTPSRASALYNPAAGIIINENITIKAIAVCNGYEDSDIFETAYTIKENGSVITPPDGGPGGGHGSADEEPAEEPPETIPAGDGSVQVGYTISGEDASLDLPDSKVTEIIDSAAAGVAIFDISILSGVTGATIPVPALSQLANAGLDVELRFAQGTVTISPDTASSAAKQANGGDVTLSFSAVAQSGLTAAQRAAINPGDTVFDVTLKSGSQVISTFDGNITVKVAYDSPLPAAVWYLSGAGELEKLECVYDPESKTVTFLLDHLSLYVVGADNARPTQNPYIDVTEDDWFYKDVMWAYENGVMTGTAADRFSPDTALDRAMAVTILWRLEGRPGIVAQSVDEMDEFTDVTEGAYYYEAVYWAAANGIVNGYGNGCFGPADLITRQDFSTILIRYMNYRKIVLPVTQQFIFFADEADISDYAMDAIQILYKLGVIYGTGTDGNGLTIIDPRGNATRAHAAAILNRFTTVSGGEASQLSM